MESERIGQFRKEYAVTNTVMSNLRMKKDAISHLSGSQIFKSY